MRYQGLPYECPELAHPLNHALDQHVLGWIGLVQFVLGIFDLLSSVWMVWKLWFHDEPWLFWCAIVTFAIHTVATAWVSFDALRVMKAHRAGGLQGPQTTSGRFERDERRVALQSEGKLSDLMHTALAEEVELDDLFETLDTEEQGAGQRITRDQLVRLIIDQASGYGDTRKTEEWIRSHGPLLIAIGVCSLSRFESLAIVRLKLRVPIWVSARGYVSPWSKMPIADKCFWRLRYSGLLPLHVCR